MRSLRARLLTATMAVAVTSVLATAWLTTRASTERLRDSVERTLETDADIYSAVLAHATTHTDWDGVDGLVADLSEETGRRIALTTPDGDVIVDSARQQGHDPPLPDRPAAVVDPFNPMYIADGSGLDVTGLEEVDPDAAPGLAAGYTPAEQAEQQRLLDEAVACVRANGHEPEAGFEDGYPYIHVVGDGGVDVSDAEALAVDTMVEGCTDPLLYAPPRAEREVDEAIARHQADCLTVAGVEFVENTDETGVPWIDVPEGAPPGDVAELDRCGVEADRAVNGASAAEVAHLYLGERGRQGITVARDERARTFTTLAVVVALAFAVTLLASRRVLRPVAALTAAAGRLEAGDRDQRVDERGRDELAGLARAFNRMADALSEHERRRRRLASDVAHELRTPLSNLRGYVEAAQDGVTPTDPALLASLHEEALLLQRLVDDLQTLSLAEAGRLPLALAPTELAELAEQVVGAFRLAAESSGVVLAAEAPEGPVRAEVDPVRLRQILGNLVANALRHTPAGGSVTVTVRPGTITVTDTGEGIDAEHLPHVFDRFWRADESRTRDTGGSGLGLAICRQLAELHGGTLEATSPPGGGATFTLEIG